MTWHQNQQQLGNIWECRSRSPKHESHWGSLSQIRLEKWMKQPSRFSWLMNVDDVPILYSLFVGSNPHFSGVVDPAAMTSRRQVAQTLCTSPGLQLTHVSGLIGDKNHGDLIRIQWGYRQKSAVALSKKFHTTFYGNFKWEHDISNCWMEWGMSVQTSMLHCGLSWPYD